MGSKTRFAKALEYIKEHHNEKQTDVCKKLNEFVVGLSESDISKYKNNYASPSDEVIRAMCQLYNINPDYLNGQSKVLLDGAGRLLENINSFFEQWHTVEKSYTNEDGNRIADKYLLVSMDRSMYEFLIDVDSAKFFEEQGMKSFDEELEKCKRKCNEAIRQTEEFVILPTNSFIEILTAEKRNRKILDECIDYEKYISFLDSQDSNDK